MTQQPGPQGQCCTDGSDSPAAAQHGPRAGSPPRAGRGGLAAARRALAAASCANVWVELKPMRATTRLCGAIRTRTGSLVAPVCRHRCNAKRCSSHGGRPRFGGAAARPRRQGRVQRRRRGREGPGVSGFEHTAYNDIHKAPSAMMHMSMLMSMSMSTLEYQWFIMTRI